MKIFLTQICLLVTTLLFAQNTGINLIKTKSNDTIFLKEHRRIKIKTSDGMRLAGKFTVINDSMISIKNKIINLNNVVSIRKASTFSSVVRTVSIGLGTALVLGTGVAAILEVKNDSGTAAVAALILAVPMVIMPISIKKHPTKKWKYEIVR